MEQSTRDRVWLGLQMFPALVGGNMDIRTKLDSGGKLLLLVVFQNDRVWAKKMAESLDKRVNNIYKYPIRTDITEDIDFKAYNPGQVAGVFVSEQLSPDRRTRLVSFGIRHRIVIFSPFVKDVEEGVTAGLHISTQTRPALNLTTIRKSGLRMNKLFFKVAKTYE